ncbi:hypothetical protein [Pseudorhizobium banfieldiae]|uniref:hypothetical protein n=1 Tax=Pseudorhizobium banfieldiae TaxID=1125847 RepID=UPI000A9B97F4|nr:hypothetical protein [Pseudorhizobium banfieldiae]
MRRLPIPQPDVAQNIFRQVADINLADAATSEEKAVPDLRQETPAIWQARLSTP